MFVSAHEHGEGIPTHNNIIGDVLSSDYIVLRGREKGSEQQ